VIGTKAGKGLTGWLERFRWNHHLPGKANSQGRLRNQAVPLGLKVGLHTFGLETTQILWWTVGKPPLRVGSSTFKGLWVLPFLTGGFTKGLEL